jgi:hypothetical protein
MFFIGVLGMFLSMKLANDLRQSSSETQQFFWIFFQWIALIYQIVFSYQIFELIHGHDHFKLLVFIFTLTDVFVIFSISIIFVSWENRSEPEESRTIPEVSLKIIEDLPPSYEEVMQLNR